jgi:hypothetical protein
MFSVGATPLDYAAREKQIAGLAAGRKTVAEHAAQEHETTASFLELQNRIVGGVTSGIAGAGRFLGGGAPTQALSRALGGVAASGSRFLKDFGGTQILDREAMFEKGLGLSLPRGTGLGGGPLGDFNRSAAIDKELREKQHSIDEEGRRGAGVRMSAAEFGGRLQSEISGGDPYKREMLELAKQQVAYLRDLKEKARREASADITKPVSLPDVAVNGGGMLV